jgi:hypothetical protein
MSCPGRFNSAPEGQALILSAFLLILFSVSPAMASPQALAEPDHLVIREAELTRAEAAEEPGMVWLEMAEKEPGDPAGTVRLQAVLAGPLEGEGAEDLYALNAVLLYSPQRLAYVAGSVRKGELLGRDGRDFLITAGVTSGPETRLTIGASRIGRVPGVKAPRDRVVLFTVALQVLAPGETPLSWENASFIDSQVRPVEAARFIGGTLHILAAEAPSPVEGAPAVRED